MSSGKNPLMLMMALTMPGAAHALGLGDIHVDSALNERLVAQIDIVGATALELTDLRASVANRETFLRYGADRPAFLTSAVFTVTEDSQGRPVLSVRSSEAFNEPVVNFLVDLQWRNGELVRQYTLLLDPAEFAAKSRAVDAKRAAEAARAAAIVAAPTVSSPASAPYVPASDVAAATALAAPAQATPIAAAQPQTAARPMTQPSTNLARKTTQIKVGARATLRGIAWRVGERTESDLQRMMIALFRANPAAFDGNINRLRRGAVLSIPSQADLAAISKAEAKHEVADQMAAWRTAGRAPARVARGAEAPTATLTTPVAPPAAATSTPATTPTTAASTSATAVITPSATPTDASLDRRVQSLEQELSDMKGLLDSERERLSNLQEQSARAERSTTGVAESRAAATPVIKTPRARPGGGHGAFVPVLTGVAGLAAALAALYFRLRRRRPLRNDREGDAASAGTLPESMPESAAVASQEGAPFTPQPQPLSVAHGAADMGAAPLQARVEQSAFDDTATDVAADVQGILTSGADDATHPLLPVLSGVQPVGGFKPAGRSEIAGGMPRTLSQDTTVNMRIDTTMSLDSTHLDFNFVDLELTAQHVQMPSVLNEHAVVKERRTNLADVLKMAIEREPDRHDLRMKLLELYYSAAATNRQAFLETVQKFARDRDYLQPDQWDKVASMGRQIAGENPMFAEAADGDDLADCA